MTDDKKSQCTVSACSLVPKWSCMPDSKNYINLKTIMYIEYDNTVFTYMYTHARAHTHIHIKIIFFLMLKSLDPLENYYLKLRFIYLLYLSKT